MGDSARAGTIQLPRAARAASAGRRSPRRVRRPLSPRQVWSSGSPRSVGGRAEVQPSRSHHSGRPRAPATGLWPRGFSASDAELGRRPGPCGRLSSASGPDPTDAQTSPAVAGESRGLACLSNAARGPTGEPGLLGGPSVRVLGERRHHVVAAALRRCIPAGPSPWA